MRRFVLLGLILTLPGCAGFGEFITDSTRANPNAPLGNSENMRRVSGLESTAEPLVPEPGNIWPSAVAVTPTLEDLVKQGNNIESAPPPSGVAPFLPDHRQPRPGSSTPPGSNMPPLAPELQTPPLPSPPVSSTPPAPAPGKSVQTRTGAGATATGTSGYQTLTTPTGPAIIVPNGNGTSTIIRPDGSVETIPSPR